MANVCLGTHRSPGRTPGGGWERKGWWSLVRPSLSLSTPRRERDRPEQAPRAVLPLIFS